MYFTKHVLILTFVRFFSFFQFLIFNSFVSTNILRIFACEITRDQLPHAHILFLCFSFLSLETAIFRRFLDTSAQNFERCVSRLKCNSDSWNIRAIFSHISDILEQIRFIRRFIALINIFNTRKILSFYIPPQHLLYDLTSSTIPLLLKFLPTTIALRGHYRFSNNIIIHLPDTFLDPLVLDQYLGRHSRSSTPCT